MTYTVESGGARQALERIGASLSVELQRGNLRLFARFVDGKLHPPVRLAVVRVPANALEALRVHRRDQVEAGLLEHVANKLGLVEGATEIVVEYVKDEKGLHLHNVDASWYAAEPSDS